MAAINVAIFAPKQFIQMKKIVVIGSGTMGNGIAHVFAQNGHDVSLVDINQDALDKAMQTIDKIWRVR